MLTIGTVLHGSYSNNVHVMWSLSTMARRWVVDGGDGLQMWRVAGNVLNKQ
jgi:hypothetical protein